MNQTINISTSTILRFILIILGVVFLYLISSVLLTIFVAFIIAAAVDGPVDWLAKKGVRRLLATAIVYAVAISVFASALYLIVPTLAQQVGILAVNLPSYLTKLGANVQIIQEKIGIDALQNVLDKASNQLAGATSNIFGTAINIFGGIFSFIIIIVISVYLVANDKALKDFILSISPSEQQSYVLSLVERIQNKLGAWLRGQLVLMAIMGVLIYIGLTILGVKYALTLALLAGLLEIIPYLGPVLSAIPAIILAFMQAPILGVLTLLLFIVAQALENHLIVPQIMKRVVGLNPLVIIISLIVGAQLAGVLGATVAVPIAATASVFLNDYRIKQGR